MQASAGEFVQLGDQFLIAYACILGSMVPALLDAATFNIGHAVELYLKAGIRHCFPNKGASEMGHSIKDMVQELRPLLPVPMREFRYIDVVPDEWLFSDPPLGAYSSQDDVVKHFINHRDLYWIVKFLVQTKYLGAAPRGPLKAVRAMRSVAHYDECWVRFFGAMRRATGHPPGTGVLAAFESAAEVASPAKRFIFRIDNYPGP